MDGGRSRASSGRDTDAAQVAALRRARDERFATAERVALRTTQERGSVYSREVAIALAPELGLDLRGAVWLAQRALRELERRGVLVGEIEASPPANRGIARKYFRIVAARGDR